MDCGHRAEENTMAMRERVVRHLLCPQVVQAPTRRDPVFDVSYVGHNKRVDVPYVGIAAAARALDGMRIRAFPNALHCLGGNGPRTYMLTFIRVLSFLVVSMPPSFYEHC